MFSLDKKKIIFEAYRTYPARHIFRFTAYDPPTPLLYFIQTFQFLVIRKYSS